MKPKARDKAFFSVLTILFFCCIGILILFHSTLFSGFKLIQTDPGDTRLNNYFLEHSFQWVVNPDYVGSLWSPAFFYPTEGVLAYSDNLFGTAPIYWLLRFTAASPTAFQLWMIVVSSLNFLSFFALLRYLKIANFLSGLGAFLFSFGLPRAGQLSHQQLLPHFFTPLAILAAWNFVKKPSKIWFLMLLVFCYLQVLAGIYLGWLLLLSLPIFFLFSYTLNVEVRQRFVKYWKTNRVFLVSSLLGWVVATLLTLFPYLKYSIASGGRSYHEVDSMLPRVASWLSVTPGSVLSPVLSKISAGLPMAHEHHMFMGFTTLFLALACMFSLLRDSSNLDRDERYLVRISLFTFFCIFLLSLRLPFGISLWRIIYEIIPGASAIRAVTRIWTIAYCYLLLAVFLWFNAWLPNAFSTTKKRLLAISVTCLFAVSEQITLNQPSFDKNSINREVSQIESLIQSGCDVAYLSIDPDKLFYSEHLSAMWAGINANVPVINGYSGNVPPHYGDNTKALSSAQLVDWLKYSENPIIQSGEDNLHLCIVNRNSSSALSVSKLNIPIRLLEPKFSIDFTTQVWPRVISRVQGLSGPEAWGRWSSSDVVTLTFSRPLPEKFTVHLLAHAFGPNVDKDFVARVGDNAVTFTLSESPEEKSLDFSNPDGSDAIKIDIPMAISPKELALSDDDRKLGIALIELRIIPIQ
jgi:hypothetical protein